MKQFKWLALTLALTSLILKAFSQKSGDSKLLIIIGDTIETYNKVKYALVNNNFQVKDNGNKDTLTTYSMEYDGIHCMAKAIIKGDSIQLSGAYGLKRIDDWGYTQNPKKYKPILYYKGSKGWRLLAQVASKIGGQISYSK